MQIEKKINDPLLALSKKIKKEKSVFNKNNVKKIKKISYPEETCPPSRKLYKVLVQYLDKSDKTHEKSLFFGDRSRKGCEFIDHKNKEVRDKQIKMKNSNATFFDDDFLDIHLLNGETDSLPLNWEILKEKYLS